MLHLSTIFDKYYTWRYERYCRSTDIVTGVDFSLTELRKSGYFSQCGQDKWIVERMFPNFHNGVFIDIGAYDGVSFSNTYFLEKYLGWTGIAIEPMPDIFERLNENRDCIKVNGCISANIGKARFQKITGYSEMLSGLVEYYDPRHLERIKREISAYGGNIQEIEVICHRLNSLLEEYDLKDIHYLNIDVEGAEYDILQSIDFSTVNIRVCGIENNYKDYRIPKLMKKIGFNLVAIVGDEIYVQSK